MVVCCVKQLRGVRVQSQHVGAQLGTLPMIISVLPMFSKLPHLELLKPASISCCSCILLSFIDVGNSAHIGATVDESDFTVFATLQLS